MEAERRQSAPGSIKLPWMRELALVCALALAATVVTAQTLPPKVFISADMEGMVGVVTGDQLFPTGFEYQRFREFMTKEVLAAIRGARAAGAGEIVVADAHGNGENLLIELLPVNVTVVRSWPRPLGMMQGIGSLYPVRCTSNINRREAAAGAHSVRASLASASRASLT